MNFIFQSIVRYMSDKLSKFSYGMDSDWKWLVDFWRTLRLRDSVSSKAPQFQEFTQYINDANLGNTCLVISIRNHFSLFTYDQDRQIIFSWKTIYSKIKHPPWIPNQKQVFEEFWDQFKRKSSNERLNLNEFMLQRVF